MRNIRLIQVLTFIFAINLSLVAFAAKEVGNGGKTIVCRNADKSIRSAELLDFYESRVIYGKPITLNPALSVNENLELLFIRLNGRDQYNAGKYRNIYSRFYNEAGFLAGVDLESTTDSFHIAFPAGCGVEQLAIQQNPQFPGDKKYVINKDLYDALDSTGKAGLIFHEIIYNDAIAKHFRAGSSIPVRRLNSYVATNEILTLTNAFYFDLLKQLGETLTAFGQYVIRADSLKLDNTTQRLSFTAFYPSDKALKINGYLEVTAAANSYANIEFFDFQKNWIHKINLNIRGTQLTLGQLQFELDEAATNATGEIGRAIFEFAETLELLNLTNVTTLLNPTENQKVGCSIANLNQATGGFECTTRGSKIFYRSDYVGGSNPEYTSITFDSANHPQVATAGLLRVVFYPSGYPQKIEMKDGDVSKDNRISIQTPWIDLAVFTPLYFADGGIYTHGGLVLRNFVQPLQNIKIVFAGEERRNWYRSICGLEYDYIVREPLPIEFYPNGMIKQGTLVLYDDTASSPQRFKLKTIGGGDINLRFGDSVQFSPEGLVVSILENVCF